MTFEFSGRKINLNRPTPERCVGTESFSSSELNDSRKEIAESGAWPTGMNNSVLPQPSPVNHVVGITASENKREMPRWYAIRTRGRSEIAVDAQLQAYGLETFLPLYGEVRRWSDRRKEIKLPLFPGYTFLRATASAEIRSLVLRSAGVINFVNAMGKPAAISDREIAGIQLLAERGIGFTPCAFVSIGTKVRVRGGALDGLVGNLVGRNSDCSLVISLS